MYKKFLVSMLLTAALVGCNHRPSDKQGDQADTAMPVQEQTANPVNSSGTDDGQMPVNPSAVEPAQTPPNDNTTPVTPGTPDTSSNNHGTTGTTTPDAGANKDNNSAHSAAGAQ